MSSLTELRSQHDAAMCTADRLIDLIDHYRSDIDALPITFQLNKLAGLVRVHLVQEDVQLYPQLIESDDREIANLAVAFVSEMGGLANELELFIWRWSSSAVIAGNFEEFAEAARELILHLACRIEREDRYLYPLAKQQPRKAA